MIRAVASTGVVGVCICHLNHALFLPMHVIHTRQVHDFDVERSLRHGLNQLSTIPCWLVFFTAGATEIVSPTSCTYSLVHTWT